MNLYVDDDREPPQGWALARTNEEAITVLTEARIEHLSLDYIMGRGKTTETVMQWLREHPERWPTGSITAHSSSRDGCALIEMMVKDFAPTAG